MESLVQEKIVVLIVSCFHEKNREIQLDACP